MGLDIRITNALAVHGIFALQDLTRVTAGELASLRGVGPGTRKILSDYLKKEDITDPDKANTV